MKTKAKYSVFLGFAVLLIAAIFTLAGCDTGTNGNGYGGSGGSGSGGSSGGSSGGGDGGLTLTIINNYSQPITKVDMAAYGLTIDGLSALSEDPQGSRILRDYEYTTPITPGASKVFSLKADGTNAQKDLSVFITADGIDFWESFFGGVYGDSYNRHFTVTVFPDGVVEGDFED